MISALPQILARLVEQPSGGLRLDCECLGVFGHGQGMREQPRVDGPYVRVCVVGGKCGCDQAQRGYGSFAIPVSGGPRPRSRLANPSAHDPKANRLAVRPAIRMKLRRWLYARPAIVRGEQCARASDDGKGGALRPLCRDNWETNALGDQRLCWSSGWGGGEGI